MTFGLPIRSVVLVCSLGFLILLVNSGTWLADRLALREDDSILEERLQAFILAEMEDKNIPGLSISLVHDQNTLMENGFGYADPEEQISASPYTVYRGGTLAQLFTTIAVLQRVEHQKLDLDLPVSDYINRFMPYNPYGLPLTLRQILSHQSGLVTEPPIGHVYDTTTPPLAETVASLNQTSVIYPPETFTKYSSAGFAIAGYILETSLEKPFEQHMRAILDRMYLKRTSFTPRFDLISKLAVGHINTFDKRQLKTPHYEPGNGPAVNVYTTTNDLGAFLKVLFADGLSPKGKILNAESFEEMWTIQMSTARRHLPYGLGFAVSIEQGERRAVKSSNINGFSGRIDLLPDSDMGVAILANVEHADAALERIASYALQLVKANAAGNPLPGYPEYKEPAASLKTRVVGHYTGDASLKISQTSQNLYLHEGLARLRLRQKNDTLFVDDPLQHGPALIADGLTLLFKEQFSSKQRNAPPFTPLPASLNDVGGLYGSRTHPVIITDIEGTLYALARWRDSYRLAVTAQDTFALPDDGMYGGEKLIVRRNEQGQIEGIRFANMDLPKWPAGAGLYSYETIPLKQPIQTAIAAALDETPPKEQTARSSELVDLTIIDPLLNIDMPLTTEANLFGEQVYSEARALVQQPVAEALFRIQRQIRRRGHELIIFDTFRPWHISKAMWESVPDSLRFFVDDPAVGTCQNRGAAVSLSFFELETSQVMPMPTAYGILSPHAFADSPLPETQLRWNRDLLRRTMEAEGFKVSPYKWWHFIHESCPSYPVINESFEAIDQESMMRQQRIFTID